MSLPHILINLDTIADLRDSRRGNTPDPVQVAMAAQSFGADGFTLGVNAADKKQRLRDFSLLRHLAKGPVYMALTASTEALRAAYEVKPNLALLVDDGAMPFAAYPSYDVVRFKDQLRSTLQSLKEADIPAAILLEPDLELVKIVHRLDVPMVVLNCNKLAQTNGESSRQEVLTNFIDVVKSCHRMGIEVAVMGNLSDRELRLLAPIEEIQTIILGHWLWSEALTLGLDRALANIHNILIEGPKR